MNLDMGSRNITLEKMERQDDAATANWGSAWRMPTGAELEELVNYTDREWATINSVKGFKFMKKTDHSVFIFLPAAGYRRDDALLFQGRFGKYWSSELSWEGYDNARNLAFTDGGICNVDKMELFCGYSVRPVLAQ